jgi:putative transposase
MTVYSPTPSICYLIGSNDFSRIYRLCKILDKLMSVKVTRKNSRNIKSTDTQIFVKKKNRFNRAKAKLRDRIKHLVDEVHWKTINFLTSNFDNIILPPFNVSSMVKRKNRKISKKSVRQMLCWRHYTFRKRLQDYVASLQNTKLFIRSEHYTSKTCTSCQQIKHNLGGAKIFNCPHCKVKINRDVVGARNIFLKNASWLCHDIATLEP